MIELETQRGLIRVSKDGKALLEECLEYLADVESASFQSQR